MNASTCFFIEAQPATPNDCCRSAHCEVLTGKIGIGEGMDGVVGAPGAASEAEARRELEGAGADAADAGATAAGARALGDDVDRGGDDGDGALGIAAALTTGFGAGAVHAGGLAPFAAAIVNCAVLWKATPATRAAGDSDCAG